MLKIWTALARVSDAANALADALLSLAATARQANDQARQQLGLEQQPLALEASAEDAADEPVASASRNGSKKRQPTA